MTLHGNPLLPPLATVTAGDATARHPTAATQASGPLVRTAWKVRFGTKLQTHALEPKPRWRNKGLGMSRFLWSGSLKASLSLCFSHPSLFLTFSSIKEILYTAYFSRLDNSVFRSPHTHTYTHTHTHNDSRQPHHLTSYFYLVSYMWEPFSSA